MGSSGDLEWWSFGVGAGDGLDVVVELACDEPFQAADGVAFGVSFGDAPL